MPPTRPSSVSCPPPPSSNPNEAAPASPSPGTRVSLPQSVAGALSSFVGGLAPRTAITAGNANGSQARHVSPSPTSTRRTEAPSPVPHPLPSLSLIPKPTNVPSSAAALVRKASRSRIRTRTPSPGPEVSKPASRFKVKSKSKSRTRSKSKPKSPAPPKSANSNFEPASPTDEVTRRKAFNLFSFRANAHTTSQAAQPERDQRTDEEREAERWAGEVARLEAETDRILAEQKKLHARSFAQLSTPQPRLARFLSLEKLPFLSRARWSNATSSQAGTPSPKAPTVFSVDLSRSSFEDSALSDKMSFIEQGGRGIVPNVDAPTSASNGGERRVTVRCSSSTINLPVTPDTSPVDLLYSTANLTPHNIDPKQSILIECYVDLGLERRLRRYERVRDVMNSWDRDQQNSLLVVTKDLSDDDLDSDLDIKSVPRTPQAPPGFTLQLYHSSRPGKWNKRWITLLESGQMFSAKKPDGKASDKDSAVLCHLSDFDIYTPRESEVKRHLKAPRKYCYAVKSQQKTFVFPNGENFVHFFCAEDNQLAQRFFDLVQRWRSWYLVTKHIDFQKKEKPYERLVSDTPPRISHSSDPANKGNIPKSTSTVTNGGHRLKVSVDESPYTIGDFQPLIDLERFDKPLEEFGKDFEPAPTLSRSQSKHQKVLTKRGPQVPSAALLPQGVGSFSPNGLLGSGYEQKRKMAERAERASQGSSKRSVEGPFTEGPSLLNGGVGGVSSPQEQKPEAQAWLPSASEHSAQSLQSLQSRAKSVRNPRRNVANDASAFSNLKQKPQPLVNLTNFPEPPRWREDVQRSQGHGHQAPTGNNGPLVNFATGGQQAQMIGPGLIRSATRAGNSMKSTPPISSSSTASSLGSRPRSRSNAGMQQPSRGPPPLIPPLPIRSIRREQTMPVDGRGRDPRPREPLINRAGTNGAMSRY
ncbi:hypothetical protein B0T10DRAFT_401613 [Thelonectria olida]|uniref:PH domain-containing protein n=1 Tax=Thelonectria olida TaxID=1576542 RepID=A0A9P8WA96_9HYPO|nr:hypothetical protein B0T10DRAFT_401613 [Thelonectria olida]